VTLRLPSTVRVSLSLISMIAVYVGLVIAIAVTAAEGSASRKVRGQKGLSGGLRAQIYARAAAHQEGLAKRLAKRLVKRNHGSVEGSQNEREFYREIIRRATTARERAAESLRRSRALPKRQGDLGKQAEAAKRRRRFRRQD
jgi:hypothetical protein